MYVSTGGIYIDLKTVRASGDGIDDYGGNEWAGQMVGAVNENAESSACAKIAGVASFPGRFLRGREKTAWAPLFAHAWDIP